MKEQIYELGQKFKKYATNASHYALNLASQGIQWGIDHPEIVTAVGVPVTIAAIRSSQSLIVSHRINKERKIVERTWYDHSNNFRWDLRRKMTNNDRKLLLQYKASGLSSEEALSKLRLI